MLSESSEGYDRGLKFAHYRGLESLREYALVSQAYPHVEIYRRQASGEWVLAEWTGLETACQFASLGCEIPLAEIYRHVKFEEAETAEP